MEDKSPPIQANEQLTRDLWMVRPCQYYTDEYSDCTSWGARRFQYYVHGEFLDCSQWKQDYVNCEKWLKSEDSEALLSVIESEKNRRKERLIPHVKNNVWEKRTEPPADWNKPLPEFMEKTKNNWLTAKLEADKVGTMVVYSRRIKEVCSIQ